MMRRLFCFSITLGSLLLVSCGDSSGSTTRSVPSAGVNGEPTTTDTKAGAEDDRLEPYVRVAFDHPSNLFPNASFENESRAPWGSMADGFNKAWKDWKVTSDQPKSGEKSARLVLEAMSEPHDFRSRVTGAMYGYQPKSVPRTISGSYFVEEWDHGTKHQYLQVVISVFRIQEIEMHKDAPLQVAWVLGGTDKTPLPMTNRKFVIAGPKQPVIGEWVDFDLDVHQTLLDEWGLVPERFTGVRVFFEVRYDQIQEHQRDDVNAVVYYDDLYMGNGG